jgi:hypothetical protein
MVPALTERAAAALPGIQRRRFPSTRRESSAGRGGEGRGQPRHTGLDMTVRGSCRKAYGEWLLATPEAATGLAMLTILFGVIVYASRTA